MLISGFFFGGGGAGLVLECCWNMCVLCWFRAHFTFFRGGGFAVLRHLPKLDLVIRSLALGCSCCLKTFVLWRFRAHFKFFVRGAAVNLLRIYRSHQSRVRSMSPRV